MSLILIFWSLVAYWCLNWKAWVTHMGFLCYCTVSNTLNPLEKLLYSDSGKARVHGGLLRAHQGQAAKHQTLLLPTFSCYKPSQWPKCNHQWKRNRTLQYAKSRNMIGYHLTNLATHFICSPEYYILGSNISIFCIHQTSFNFSPFRNVLKYFVPFSFVPFWTFIFNLKGVSFKMETNVWCTPSTGIGRRSLYF